MQSISVPTLYTTQMPTHAGASQRATVRTPCYHRLCSGGSVHCTHKQPGSSRSRRIPRTQHLSISTSFLRCIVCIQYPHRLPTFVSSTEGISSLLPHSLYLPHFPDCFLELFHPRSVVLHIVLLYLLYVVICLWEVHSLCILPRKVSCQTDWWQHQAQRVEHRRREHGRYEAVQFSRPALADVRSCI